MPKKLIVIKVGTSSLTDENGKLDLGKIRNITDQLSSLHRDGHRLVLVTSGAIAAGYGKLGFSSRPSSIPDKQASAAVGQGLLMEIYSELFSENDIVCGQILLNKDDFADRVRYSNAFNSLEVLLSRRAIPVINENDAVSVDEIRIGDNDTLSAQVAAMVHADLLVMVSDIDGLYTADPSTDPDASKIETVSYISPELLSSAAGSSSMNGTGGMITKLRGALIAASAGVETVLTSYSEEDSIIRSVNGTSSCTRFLPSEHRLNVRRQWVAFYGISKGNIYIDDNAQDALIKRKASLLSGGIVAAEGDFLPGDITEVFSMGDHRYIGRGISEFSRNELIKLISERTASETVINRNNFVLTYRYMNGDNDE